jgi:predicted nuclease of predicted toxin-antitoxin system
MRFKVDENLPVQVVDLLRDAGHDALSVLDQGLRGRPDEPIAKVCQDEGRVLVSLDLDFANIRAFPPPQYPGLIVLRLAKQDMDHVVGIMRRLVSVLAARSLERKLWIVEENRIRERG